LARPDFRGTAARRLSEERELSPAIISLLSPEGSARATSIRQVPVGRIDANPDQPRLTFDEGALAELSSSVKEHGVLQPILVRPHDGGRYQLIAGERRWRAAKMANLETIPAMIEDDDDDTRARDRDHREPPARGPVAARRSDHVRPMTSEHGYSVRKLAQKLGKDKGYIENRLRLADAPPEIRELVSLRKDTVSHAYELLKVEDPRKRRRLAEQVASGELSLVRLREKIEGRRSRGPAESTDAAVDEKPSRGRRAAETDAVDATAAWTGVRPTEISEDSLISAKGHLAEALDELVMVLRSPEALDAFGDVDRGNLAKYLTISKLKLENAIALVRSGTADREG
jgi:ParB family chromosome partitioning protein